jgi:hypothetical protein
MWRGEVVIGPLRRRAIVVSVLAWLAVVGPVLFVTGMLIVMVTRDSANSLSLVLGVTSVFVSAVTWLSAAIGATAWLWRARINAGVMSAARHRLSVQWAAMGWFVPVAGPVVALIMVTDVVRAVLPAGPSITLVRWWWSAWIAGSVLLPACAAVSVYRLKVFVALVVLAVVLLAVAAWCFTRITLAVAAAQDAELRQRRPPWRSSS